MAKGSSGAAGQWSRARKMPGSVSLRMRAIRAIWVIARHNGLSDGTMQCLMHTDAQVRDGMMRAWLAGYRQGRGDVEGENARRVGGGA